MALNVELGLEALAIHELDRDAILRENGCKTVFHDYLLMSGRNLPLEWLSAPRLPAQIKKPPPPEGEGGIRPCSMVGSRNGRPSSKSSRWIRALWESRDDDDDERDECAEKNEAADVGCFVPFVLVVVTHPHAPSLSERWRAIAVSGPR